MMRNRYARGEPHGKGRWLFVDGSSYEGESTNGRITGRGKYTRSDMYKLQGRFLNGVLHGPDCTQSQRVAPEPLLNDSDAQGAPLRLSRVRKPKTKEDLAVAEAAIVVQSVVKQQSHDEESEAAERRKMRGRNPGPVKVRELRGFFAHGEPQRACVMIKSDEGLNYTGSWKRGRYHGRGTLVLPTQDRYYGWFKFGQRFRRGTPQNPDYRYVSCEPFSPFDSLPLLILILLPFSPFDSLPLLISLTLLTI